MSKISACHRVHERAPRPSPRILPVFTRIHRLRHARESHCPLHQHLGDFEIVAVDRGVYRTRLNHVPLTLKPSRILVVKPGDWHEDFFSAGLCFHTIYFHLESSLLPPEASLLFKPGVSARAQVARVPAPEFRPLFKRIQQESERPDFCSAGLQDALSTEFFWLLVRNLGRDAVADSILGLSEDERFRGEVVRLFQRHVHGALSVPEMARALGMGVSSLAHRYKSLTGCSLANAFTAFKVSQARLLLEHTDMNVKEVSARFGFENPYHFSRVFKKTAGSPPSSLQK